jgi:F-type H+-transporting ATPase subunit b
MTRIARLTLLTLALLAAFAGRSALAAAPEVEKTDHGTTAAPAHGAGHDDTKAELLRGPEAGLIPALTTLIVFVLLVAVLGKFAWGPISQGLKAREDKIRHDIEEAEAARARAEATMKEYQAQLATAEARVRELLSKAEKDAEQISQGIRATAEQEAQATKGNALRDIDQAKREAVREVHEQAVILSTRAAEKILRRNINADDQRDLVRASLEELQTVKG